MIKFEPLVYNKTYHYPAWGTGIGWVLALSSMLIIPIYAIYRFAITPGTILEVSETFNRTNIFWMRVHL